MSDTNKMIKRVIIHSLIFVAIVSIALFFIFDQPMKYILGLLFGYAFNLVFFRLMYLNISKAMDMTEDKAKSYITVNYIARYIISGFVLLIAASYSYLNIFTCFIGLLSIKLVIHLRNFYLTLKSSMKK